MVNETRSGIKINDDGCSNSSKKKSVVGKVSSTLGVGISDATGLRRSPRGDTSLSNQNAGSPANTRKSGRLVKHMQVSPLSEKKTEKVKKQVTISPSRRSDRGKKHTLSSSWGLNKSEKLSDLLDDKEMEGKGEKRLKQLAGQVKEVSESEDTKPVSVKRKKWDGHNFKALLKKHRIGRVAADGDVVKTSDRVDTVEGTLVDAEKLLADCSTEDPLQISDLAGFPSKRRRVDHESLSKDFSSCSTPLTKGSDESSILEKESLTNLSVFPAGNPPGLDSRYLKTLNKLQEFLHKGQSAVVFDDQDRIMTIILFIRSLNDICQPFLIISSSDSLPLWETELLRMAPSMNIVFYIGNSDNRRSIRKMKFYDKGGRIMFQVLLSTLDATVEDLQVFESLKWKAVIVDECQQPQVSSQFELIKLLAKVKVLLFSGPIKDSVAEYVHLLSLLGCADSVTSDGPKTEQNDIYKLKERLSPYIAYECKSDSSKFVEYWVPSQISNVQLEQYCRILLSNAIPLRLCLKTDPVGALGDIVFSARKCCDHPYIVDPSLKSLITKDLPAVKFLDVGIKASGKLQLLDLILSEMNKRQLRVLILFQSIGGFGKDTLGQGDILDDFLRERFGPETYERVDGGAISSKSRRKALDSFNKKSGRFVFLLENRACLASIRLSAVDTIIIFNSDWDPANDVKALHKISIDSQFKQIKIFRLYSPCTLEEKVLILAKQGLENKLQNISHSTCNMLLMWGASYLMNRLDEFHSTSDMNISSDPSLLTKVVEEFLALLSQNGENSDIENPIILRAPQSGGVYSSNLKLLGELKVQLSDELLHDFWTNLLKERNPRWKFLSGTTQKHRKKVHYLDESPNKADTGTVEGGRKRKKEGSNCIDPASLKAGLEQGGVEVVEGGDIDIPNNDGFHNLHRPDASEADTLHTSKGRTIEADDFALPDEQKSLYLLVKPDISKLCEILNFSKEAKLMVGRFLEYVISNHQILKEPASILQAFLISLCWTAASLIKQKVDRKDSLNLAKCQLNFCCNEEEANCLYSVLRKLKKTFIKENILEIDCSKGPVSGAENGVKGPLSERVSQLMSSNVPNEGVILSQASNGVLLPRNKQNDKTQQENTLTNFKWIERKFQKRMAKFHQKQEEETKVFHEEWERRRAALINKYRVESAIIREVYSHMQSGTDKLKVLNNEHAKKLEELEQKKEIEFKQLKTKQLGALTDEKMKIARWLKSASSSANEHRAQDEPLLHGSKERRLCSVSENDATLSDHFIEEQSPNEIADNRHACGIMAADTCMTTPNQAEGCNYQSCTVNTPNLENDLVEVSPVVRSLQPDGMCSLFNISENNGSTSQCHSAKKITDEIILTGPGEMVPLELPKDIAEEEMGAIDSVEIGAPAVESNRENDRSGGVCSDTPNKSSSHDFASVELSLAELPISQLAPSTACDDSSPPVESNRENDRSDGVYFDTPNRSISHDSASVELSLAELPISQPAPSKACDDSLSQNMVLPHEFCQTPLSVDVEDEDRLVEVPSSQPVDAEQIDQPDHESPIVAPREQPQPQPSLSTSSLLEHNQHEQPPASGSAHGTISEMITPQSVGVSFHLSKAPQELPDRAVSFPVVDLVLPPRIDDTEIPLVHNQTDPSPSIGSSHGTITEGITPTGVSCNLLEVPPEPSDQAISLPMAGVVLGAPINDMEIPVVHNQPDPPASGSVHGTITEDVTPHSAEVSCQLLEVPLEPSDRAVSLPAENVVLHLPISATEIPLVHNQLDLQSASRHVHQVIGDLNSSFHNDEAPSQVVGHIPELPNQVIPHVGESVELHHARGVLQQNQHGIPSCSRLDCQTSGEALRENAVLTTELPNQVMVRTGVNMSTAQGLNDLPLHVEPQVPSRITSLPLYGDPLQNELMRIRKETEQTMKIYEDMKLMLKAELDEIIFRAHREYEVKLKDAESAYLLKKNELDINNNKVLMNKILADAFRSKCLDIGPSMPMTMQQGVPPGSTQHLNQSPLNPRPRSSPVAGSSLVGQTEANQQNTVLLSQPASRHHPVSVSVSTGQPAANLQNMAPHVQPAGTVSPVFVSSLGGLPASSQQVTTPLLQPASRLFSLLTDSSLTAQPAASQQNTAAQLQPAPSRVSPVPVSSSVGQLTARRLNALVQLPPASGRRNTSVQSPPASRVSHVSISTTAGHPAASHPSSTAPLQIVHQSAALFSSTLPRPPQINPITPSTGNHRAGNEIRAPAPHLQPFRSSSSPAVNLTSVPRVVPSHLTPTTTTSRSFPNTSAFPRAASVNYPCNVQNISPQSNAANGLSMADLLSPINPSSSCMDMIRDIHKQHSTQRSSNVGSLPDLGSKLDSLDLSVFENGVNALVNSTPVTLTVVCLSDDD